MIKAGDRVKLVAVPDSLVHDLPLAEQIAIQANVGRIMIVERVDSFGFVWVGFGETLLSTEDSTYIGHCFSVEANCLERVGSD